MCSTETNTRELIAILLHDYFCLTTKMHVGNIIEQGDTLDTMSWHYIYRDICSKTMQRSGSSRSWYICDLASRYAKTPRY